MKYFYQVGAQIFEIELEKTSDGYRAITNGEEFAIRVTRAAEGELSCFINTHPRTIYFAMRDATRFIAFDGKTYALNAAPRRGARHDAVQAHSDEDSVRAPMPGHVRAVQAKPGDTVERGQTLLILEAMKMEIKIQAPRAGRIQKVLVKQGELVEREQTLVEIE